METTDIALAAYLISKGVQLQSIRVDDLSTTYPKCTFILDEPDNDDLQAWLQGTAIGNAKEIIQSYRHLLRDARVEIERSKRNGVSSRR